MTEAPSGAQPPTEGTGPSGELFPREELAEEVGRHLDAEDRRQALAPWVLALAVGLLALGLPTERLWGPMRLVTDAAEGGRSVGVLAALLRLLAQSEALTIESAARLVTALCAGLTIPAMRSLLATIGFPGPLCWAGTALALFTPLTLLGATSPVELAPSILGATLLARELFRLRSGMGPRAQWRVSSTLLLAVLLDPANLLLLPAGALAVARLAGRRGVPRWAPGASLVAVLAWCVWILLGAGEDPGGRAVDALFTSMLAGASGPSASGLLAWLIWAPIALGVGWIGLASLLMGRRSPEESPPPRWVAAWCAMALVPVLGGHPGQGPALGLLVPIGAVGLADHLLRIEDADRARGRARILVGSQVLLGVLALVVLRVTDPVRPWAERARRVLEPSDVVIATDPAHLYWLRHRFLLEARDPRREHEPGPTGRPEGRLVLDDPLPDGLARPADAVDLSALGG